MKKLSRDNKANVVLAGAAMLIVAVVAAEAHLSTGQALWLASMNVSATVIVTIMICGPFLLGIALLAALAYWPEIRWYLWRRRHFRRAIERVRRREDELANAGVTESAVLATVLPGLSECMFVANRSVFASSSSPELLAYQAVAEAYIARLQRIADCGTEETAARTASLQAQLRHHRTFLSSFT